VRSLAGVYVEALRNTPLLVQLFFWYTAVILPLPNIRDAILLGDFALISNRGVAMGWPYVTESGGAWLWWLVGGLVVAWIAWRWRRAVLDNRGRLDSALPTFFVAFAVVAVIGYFVTDATATLPAGVTYELDRGDRGTLFVDLDGDGVYTPGVDRPMRRMPITLLDANGAEIGATFTAEDGSFRFYDLEVDGETLRFEAAPPVVYSAPAFQNFNVRGGRTFSPEFVALLMGLTLYTGAFIAEIVRAGINSVPKGQWEASRAVGLSAATTLRLIVLPQALRVIIPPLTSQYLNLAKNSSLAIAVGYPDLFNISLTIMNQSGAAVQMFLIIMATYLTISLTFSLLMNLYNRRIALVER
jgi:general L-amino acid transport system permease protein